MRRAAVAAAAASARSLREEQGNTVLRGELLRQQPIVWKRAVTREQIYRPLWSKYLITVNSNKQETPEMASALPQVLLQAFEEDHTYIMRRVAQGEGKIAKKNEHRLPPIRSNDLLQAENRQIFSIAYTLESGNIQRRLHLHATVEIAHRMPNLGNPVLASDEVKALGGEPIGLRLYGQLLRHICTWRLRKMGLLSSKDNVNVDVRFVASHMPLQRYLSKTPDLARTVLEEDIATLADEMQSMHIQNAAALLRAPANNVV